MEFVPLEHQKLAIDHLYKHDRALLFAGMGLGKTAATIEAFSRRFADGKCRGVLIVAPLRVAVLTWPDEIAKWSNYQEFTCANLRTKEGLQHWKDGSAQFYCINYESLPSFTKKHIEGKRSKELPVNAVVFDEISVAKSHSSKRINYFRRAAIKKFPIRQGLTGTPTPNSYLDIFAPLRLIDDGERLGKAYTRFRGQHFVPENPWSDWPRYVLRPGSEELIENAIADMTLTLRTKDWLNIPPTILKDIPVTLPKEARTIYNNVENELLHHLSNGDKIKAVSLGVLAGKLQQIAGGAIYKTNADDEATSDIENIHSAKIDALRTLKEEEDGSSLLVACNYRHEQQRIIDELGAVAATEETIRDWNAGKVPMLVAHPKSIGHGLNLQQGGSRCVWFSLTYSRELYDQFNARLARTGQKHETTIYRLICKNTIDEAVAGVLHNKGQNQDAFLATLQNIQRLKGRKVTV